VNWFLSFTGAKNLSPAQKNGLQAHFTRKPSNINSNFIPNESWIEYLSKQCGSLTFGTAGF
ncbi:MAG: hypothetical protein P4M02_03505, partial [Clostridia bacterium]|nr:hypothetical protein [Clostridia bacterium]